MKLKEWILETETKKCIHKSSEWTNYTKQQSFVLYRLEYRKFYGILFFLHVIFMFANISFNKQEYLSSLQCVSINIFSPYFNSQDSRYLRCCAIYLYPSLWILYFQFVLIRKEYEKLVIIYLDCSVVADWETAKSSQAF